MVGRTDRSTLCVLAQSCISITKYKRNCAEIAAPKNNRFTPVIFISYPHFRHKSSLTVGDIYKKGIVSG